MLTAAAAVAIDNAQLFEQVQAAATWTSASREITTGLLSGMDPHSEALKMIAARAGTLTGAEQAIVLLPGDDHVPVSSDAEPAHADTLVVSTAVGADAVDLLGQRVPLHESTAGTVFRSGTAVITETFQHPIPAFTDAGPRPAIVMPLRAQDTVVDVIVVARASREPPFEALRGWWIGRRSE